MHKRIPVAEIEVDNAAGFILKIYKIYAPEHLPVGVSFKDVDRPLKSGKPLGDKRSA